jgi:hypothetical protein
MRNVYMCRPIMVLFNEALHLELRESNVHYTVSLADAISERRHNNRGKTAYV